MDSRYRMLADQPVQTESAKPTPEPDHLTEPAQMCPQVVYISPKPKLQSASPLEQGRGETVVLTDP